MNASDYFDIRTLSLTAGIVAMTMWGCMLFVAASQKVYPGFKIWTTASLFNGVGFTLLSMRGVLPDFLTIVVANLFIIGFYILLARGLLEFVGSKQRIWLDITPLLVVFITFLYFTYYSPNVNARIVIISLFIALLCWRSALIVYKQVPLLLFGTNWFLLTVVVLIGVWFFLRIILTSIFENQILDFMSAGALQGIIFVVSIIGNITILTGCIIINAQRLEYDLVRAKNQVKSLSGLLPICSSCKKIRDDQGYWHDVAVYVRDHSEADFSHGICPDCMERLYPDYAKRIGKKE